MMMMTPSPHSHSPSHSASPSTAITARHAGDDGVQNGDNAIDDGSEDGADSVDDSHQTVTDGCEDCLKLDRPVSIRKIWRKGRGEGDQKHTQDRTAPILNLDKNRELVDSSDLNWLLKALELYLLQWMDGRADGPTSHSFIYSGTHQETSRTRDKTSSFKCLIYDEVDCSLFIHGQSIPAISKTMTTQKSCRL